MTREEWSALWWDEFYRLRKEFPSRDLQVLHKAATTYMTKRYGPRPGDGPSVKDKIIRKLALRWLAGKLKSLRGKDKETGMGKVLKFLDGWKLVIGVVVLIGVKVFDGLNNGHAGDIVGLILTMIGWNPSAELGIDFAQAAGAVMVLVGVGHKVVKAKIQSKAGASATELLSAEGYVAEAKAKK